MRDLFHLDNVFFPFPSAALNVCYLLFREILEGIVFSIFLYMLFHLLHLLPYKTKNKSMLNDKLK